MSSPLPFERVVVCYGGELAKDVAQQIISKQPSNLITNDTKVIVRNASERPTQLVEYDHKTLVCFVLQTVENGAATEEVCTITRTML